MSDRRRIAVVGLGYVGLPLAVALARHYPVTGFDVDAQRIRELQAGEDRTRAAPPEALRRAAVAFTGDAARLGGCAVYIVAVPTPIDAHRAPDLGALRAACRLVGGAMGRGAIVAFESTVYPGVTEEICAPELARASGLACGRDFFVGYAPERSNPGDREHTLDRIARVVAGQNEDVTARLAEIYGRTTSGGVFVARDIRTAEAAKAIENAQRDINIAFVNEIATICHKMGLSTRDVLAAAATKWNFLDFSPGLVGGHCVGVDPFYLAHAAVSSGHRPEIVLAGRRINDAMSGFVADCIVRELTRAGRGRGARVLVLGLTFKENVPDLRNSRVVDLVAALSERGFPVDVHDPCADPEEAGARYGIRLRPDLRDARGYAAVVGAVAHDAYRALTAAALTGFVREGGLIADVKGIWRGVVTPGGYRRWQL